MDKTYLDNGGIRLVCPICAKPLIKDDKRFICEKSHSFDIARQGYVNLLPVQNKHSLNPGDTNEMLTARRSFLDSGSYMPICSSVIDAVKKYRRTESPVVLDIGCGEGYYTELIKQSCKGVYSGIDISKDGVRMACSRSRDILWLVATASSLPFESRSVDVITAMFSLIQPEEYARVLKDGGCFIEVTVGSDHLRELKEIIYDEVFEQHKHPSPCTELFDEAECTEHRFRIKLDNTQLCQLLKMTPHFWRIHKERLEMLEKTESLELTVHYWLRAAIKKQRRQ